MCFYQLLVRTGVQFTCVCCVARSLVAFSWILSRGEVWLYTQVVVTNLSTAFLRIVDSSFIHMIALWQVMNSVSVNQLCILLVVLIAVVRINAGGYVVGNVRVRGTRVPACLGLGGRKLR